MNHLTFGKEIRSPVLINLPNSTLHSGMNAHYITLNIER